MIVAVSEVRRRGDGEIEGYWTHAQISGQPSYSPAPLRYQTEPNPHSPWHMTPPNTADTSVPAPAHSGSRCSGPGTVLYSSSQRSKTEG
jgi:hypothetical protein